MRKEIHKVGFSSCTHLSGLSFQGLCGSGRGEVSKIKGKEKGRKVSTSPS